MRRRYILNDRDELPPLAPPPLKLLQLAGQRHRRLILLRIQQVPNQRDHLLHPRRILLKQLPHQRLRFGKAARGQQCIGVGLAQLRRRPGPNSAAAQE